MRRIMWVSLLALAGLALGCGKDEKVRVGEPEQVGTVRRDIDSAKDVAIRQSAATHDGEAVAYPQ